MKKLINFAVLSLLLAVPEAALSQAGADLQGYSISTPRPINPAANRNSANHGSFLGLTVPRLLARTFAFEVDATFRNELGAVMWKITTHGFTFQEALMMAAMNIASRSRAGRANVVAEENVEKEWD